MNQIDEAYADTVACRKKECLVAESNNTSHRLGDDLIEADQDFCLSFNTSSLGELDNIKLDVAHQRRPDGVHASG